MNIRDIAKECGVSVATVSRVINNKEKGVGAKTREKVLRYMKEKGYQPNQVARSLATKKAKIIGLLLPDISNPFNAEMAKGVEEEATKQGYNIILCDSNNEIEKEEKYAKILNEYYAAGIIFNNFRYTDYEFTKKINLPMVLIDSSLLGKDDLGLPLIQIDNKEAMKDMITYLISQGHKRIAVITGYEGSYATKLRLEGYYQAYRENGLEIDPSIIKGGNFRISGGYKKADELLKEGKEFTAICCFNDLMAVGAIQRLEEKNIKVPEQISITGFDNTTMSRITHPKLTTVDQPTYEMGKAAVKALINVIENKEQTMEKKVFGHRLIIRNSVIKN